VFTDEAITDPVKLAALTKNLRRPRRRPPWFWKLTFAGSLAAALLLGILIGCFLLSP
jgi:hypothetical protein